MTFTVTEQNGKKHLINSTNCGLTLLQSIRNLDPFQTHTPSWVENKRLLWEGMGKKID